MAQAVVIADCVQDIINCQVFNICVGFKNVRDIIYIIT
jgi:hypothetical protein